MADKPTGTEMDYGRRAYMNSPDYMTAMKRRTDKHLDNTRDRIHSDDKKPYLNDEFPEMEYFFTPYNPPPWTPVVPPITPDTPPILPDDGTSLTVFSCAPKECYYRGSTTEIALNCGYPVIKVYFDIFVPDGITISGSGNTMSVTATAESDEHFRFNILMRGLNPDGIMEEGVYGPVLISSCEDPDCPAAVTFEWDTDLSAETIARNNSASVYITGGELPYNWEVAGTGFTLANSFTLGVVNTLYADGSACGSATITVTDGCGTEVTGIVRNTDAGYWNNKSSGCGLADDGDVSYVRKKILALMTATIDATTGGQRQRTIYTIRTSGAWNPGNFPTSGECDAHRAGYDCGSMTTCAPQPASIYWSGIRQGTYYLCAGDGRVYLKNCFAYGVGYTYSVMKTDNPPWMQYCEWECDNGPDCVF